MTKEEIQGRLDQAKERVEKRKATMLKICGKLGIDSEALFNDYYQLCQTITTDYLPGRTSREMVSKYAALKETRLEDGTWVEDAYDWNQKVDQLEDSFCKLFDLEKIVKNWELKLQKQTNTENVEQIPILVEFLDKWEENAHNYYKNQAEKYVDAHNEFYEIAHDFLEEHNYNSLSYAGKNEVAKEFNDFIMNNYGKRRAYRFGTFGVNDWTNGFDELTKQLTRVQFISEEPEDRYFVSDNNFHNEVKKGHYEMKSFDEERLNKMLHEEKIRKYAKLVEQVTAITGPITDVSGLNIDPRGDLNGIVIGENGKTKVNTIGAGGYNQDYINPDSGRHGQIFHYRTLVKPIGD